MLGSRRAVGKERQAAAGATPAASTSPVDPSL